MLNDSMSGTWSCSGFSARWNLTPPDDVFEANWPVSVFAFSRISVVTGAPKQAAKASPTRRSAITSPAASVRGWPEWQPRSVGLEGQLSSS